MKAKSKKNHTWGKKVDVEYAIVKVRSRGNKIILRRRKTSVCVCVCVRACVYIYIYIYVCIYIYIYY